MSALDTYKSAVMGNPYDRDKKPSRSLSVQAFAEMQLQLEAAQAGALVKDTLTNLNSLTEVSAAAVMAWVVNDPVQSNNGIYENTGTASTPVFTRRSDIPQFSIYGIHESNSTANNIVVSTDLPIPTADGRCLIIVPVETGNTGVVTISFNGQTSIPVVKNSNIELSSGELVAGMNLLGFISSNKFVLISDISSASIQAAANAALLAAQNSVYTFFETRDLATAATIPAVVMKIEVYSPELKITSQFVRDATGTALTSADGANWSPSGDATPVHWGAKGNNIQNDSPAFAGMFTWVMSDNGAWRKIYIPAGRFVCEQQYSTTVDPHDDSATNGLFIRGAGASSVIVNKNNKGWFKWVQSSARDVRFDAADFGIQMANGGSNGIPIHLEQVTGGLSRQPDVFLNRINIYPANIDEDYPVNFLRIRGFFWPHVNNSHFASIYQTNVPIAKQYRGRCSLDFAGCYSADLSGSYAWGCELGVRMTDVENIQGGEGGQIIGGTIDAWRGVLIDTLGTEPHIEMAKNHINSVEWSILCRRRKIVNIDGTLFFMTEDTAAASFTNLVPDHNDFSTWGGAATVTAAPDENEYTTVHLVEDDDDAANNSMTKSVTLAENTTYCVSALLKKGTADQTTLSLQGAGFAASVRIAWGTLDTDEPTLSNGSSQVETIGLVDMGDGWYLVYATDTVPAGQTSGVVYVWPSSFVSSGVTTGDVKVASVQVQEGNLPTPHISGTVTPTDVIFEDVEDSKMINSVFWFDGSADRVNVKADGNCRRLAFRGNEHKGRAATAYQLASGIDEVIIDRPYFDNSITNQIVDGGVTDLIVVRDKKFKALWSLSSFQSIPNSSETVVVWNSVESSYGFGNIAAQTFTVPSNKGIRRLKITLQTSWSDNDTGERTARLTKNGSTFTGAFRSYKAAQGLSQDNLTTTIDVADGDVFRILVSQDSGVAQNFGDDEAWLLIEEM